MAAKRPNRLLITVSQPQEEWLREEAKRAGLPGGVSELIRRAIDEFRDRRQPQKDSASSFTTTRASS